MNDLNAELNRLRLELQSDEGSDDELSPEVYQLRSEIAQRAQLRTELQQMLLSTIAVEKTLGVRYNELKEECDHWVTMLAELNKDYDEQQRQASVSLKYVKKQSYQDFINVMSRSTNCVRQPLLQIGSTFCFCAAHDQRPRLKEWIQLVKKEIIRGKQSQLELGEELVKIRAELVRLNSELVELSV